MQQQGQMTKMKSELGDPVRYTLPLGDHRVALNDRIGTPITLRFSGSIHCIHCQRAIKKSFNQGYCYPCFRSLAQCDLCIVKPELCHYDQGTCREPEWGETHCMQPHYLYLANSSGIKIGLTRHSQIPTRWIDQGAIQALPILKVASRFQAGLLEVVFKQHVSDQTQWQRMLKSEPEPVDLIARRDQLLALCEDQIEAIEQRFGPQSQTLLNDAEVVTIHYPVAHYPSTIKSLNFDKTAEISGQLEGIKGQYLIFDCGVLNIRKFGGYQIEISAE